MRTASKILSIIGGIVNILSGLSLIFTGIMFICLGIPSVQESIYEAIAQAADASDLPVMEYIDVLLPLAILYGILFLFESVIYFVAGGIAIKAGTRGGRGACIAEIVFGILTGGQLLLIVGGVLGAIAAKKAQQ